MNIENSNFLNLVKNVKKINSEFSTSAKRSVNINLTLRNWFIGAYICEYELNGNDRADYGERLLLKLAQKLNDLSNCNKRQLYDYLQFYKVYPQIVSTVSAQFQKIIPEAIKYNKDKMPTASAQLVPPMQIINKLSYSMLKLLIPIGDKIKRAFYEIETIRGGWSVRELNRQINSLYYERSGLSFDKEKLSLLTNQNVDLNSSDINIKIHSYLSF